VSQIRNGGFVDRAASSSLLSERFRMLHDQNRPKAELQAAKASDFEKLVAALVASCWTTSRYLEESDVARRSPPFRAHK
jgi:hypothetical protein